MPPAEFRLPGLLLRRWSPDDAGALLTATEESAGHLRPWMPWAAEPPTLAAEHEYLDGAVRRWDDGGSFEYGAFDPDTGIVLGGFGLHARVGPGGWDIGYWVHTAHTGRGIATAGAGALTEAAFALPGTHRVEIHCDEANTTSAGVPERLGYRLDRVDPHAPLAPAETGRRMIWIKP